MQSATDSLFGRLFFEEEEKPRLCFRSAPPGQSDSNTSTSFCGKCTFQKLASSSSTLFLLLLFLNHQVPTGRHDTKFQGGIKMLPSYIQEAFFFFFNTVCFGWEAPPWPPGVLLREVNLCCPSSQSSCTAWASLCLHDIEI